MYVSHFSLRTKGMALFKLHLISLGVRYESAAMASMWLFKESFDVSLTPRYLYTETVSLRPESRKY